MFTQDGGFGLPSADQVAERVRADQRRHGVTELLAAAEEQRAARGR
ncbi:hypothetical protein ACGF5O_47860 [Streptomyces sp. NPDC048291]